MRRCCQQPCHCCPSQRSPQAARRTAPAWRRMPGQAFFFMVPSLLRPLIADSPGAFPFLPLYYSRVLKCSIPDGPHMATIVTKTTANGTSAARCRKRYTPCAPCARQPQTLDINKSSTPPSDVLTAHQLPHASSPITTGIRKGRALPKHGLRQRQFQGQQTCTSR